LFLELYPSFRIPFYGVPDPIDEKEILEKESLEIFVPLSPWTQSPSFQRNGSPSGRFQIVKKVGISINISRNDCGILLRDDGVFPLEEGPNESEDLLQELQHFIRRQVIHSIKTLLQKGCQTFPKGEGATERIPGMSGGIFR
jgi:hypothetical protein